MVIEAPSASTKRSSPRARDHRLGAVDPALPSLLHPHAVVLDNKRAPLIGFTGTPIELQDADTRAVRQRVTHVARVPVDKVVLVAVRLVGNHHDVSTVGEGWVPVALFLGEELVDGRKYYAARCHR
jgi:hypothetical protein